ncbi:MAG: hypothetical protein JOS17DRAFT_730290 [Linnemannia elongata]|nr:MAG: hypothetical protein JOS17DRAFT_730290 [Linnemannia elongata]
MDYETTEPIDAPFPPQEPQRSSMEVEPSRSDSKSRERVPSVDPYPGSRSPRSHEQPYSRSRERGYSKEREERSGSRRRHRSRSRSPRPSREHRSYGEYRDHRDRDRDYRDHRERDYRDYRDSRGHHSERYDRDRRRSRSRERGSRRSRSPRSFGGGFYRRRRSPSPPADEATCDRRTVFVMQLSARLRSSELESFFSQAGKVRAARIIEDRNTGRSKGVGYVEFYDEDSVVKAIALTGQKLLGIPVIAKHTESEKNRLALQAASQAQDALAEAAPQTPPVDLSQHRLYVGSVNFDLTEEDLKQVLEPFGPIEFIKLHRDAETGKSKGFAFVQYKEAEHAKQAMERMNGYVLANRTIKVGLVTEKGSTQNQTTTGSNNGYQYNNGQINNTISMDDSDTAGYAMTSQSRAELMQKLARGDSSMGGAAPPPAVAPTPVPSFVPPRQLPVVMPSRAVLLKNMFTEEDKTEPEWAQELEEDVKEEAEKSGPVVHIHIQQDTLGDIFLKFDSVQSATNAVQTLGGRFFAGRQIVAAFLPELLYNARFPSAANL